MIGLEPTTYALPRRCATDCATSASTDNIIQQKFVKVKGKNNIFCVNKFSWENFRFFWKKGLTNHFLSAIILKQSGTTTNKIKMRVCWNRQTGTFEGRVSKDVWVQVPLLAPNLWKPVRECDRSYSLTDFHFINIFWLDNYRLLSRAFLFDSTAKTLNMARRYLSWQTKIWSVAKQVRIMAHSPDLFRKGFKAQQFISSPFIQLSSYFA